MLEIVLPEEPRGEGEDRTGGWGVMGWRERAIVHLLREGGEDMKMSLVAILVLVAGCSSGLQERAYKNEHGVYIVSQSLVNERFTGSQPHVTSELACWRKYTSEEMAEFRSDAGEHTWFAQCQPLKDYKPDAYKVALDPALASYFKGAWEAAILGAPLGTGLALSGTTVSTNSVARAGASSSASAAGGSAVSGGRHGHRR